MCVGVSLLVLIDDWILLISKQSFFHLWFQGTSWTVIVHSNISTVVRCCRVHIVYTAAENILSASELFTGFNRIFKIYSNRKSMQQNGFSWPMQSLKPGFSWHQQRTRPKHLIWMHRQTYVDQCTVELWGSALLIWAWHHECNEQTEEQRDRVRDRGKERYKLITVGAWSSPL